MSTCSNHINFQTESASIKLQKLLVLQADGYSQMPRANSRAMDGSRQRYSVLELMRIREYSPNISAQALEKLGTAASKSAEARWNSRVGPDGLISCKPSQVGRASSPEAANISQETNPVPIPQSARTVSREAQNSEDVSFQLASPIARSPPNNGYERFKSSVTRRANETLVPVDQSWLRPHPLFSVSEVDGAIESKTIQSSNTSVLPRPSPDHALSCSPPPGFGFLNTKPVQLFPKPSPSISKEAYYKSRVTKGPDLSANFQSRIQYRTKLQLQNPVMAVSELHSPKSKTCKSPALGASSTSEDSKALVSRVAESPSPLERIECTTSPEIELLFASAHTKTVSESMPITGHAHLPFSRPKLSNCPDSDVTKPFPNGLEDSSEGSQVSMKHISNDVNRLSKLSQTGISHPCKIRAEKGDFVDQTSKPLYNGIVQTPRDAPILPASSYEEPSDILSRWFSTLTDGNSTRATVSQQKEEQPALEADAGLNSEPSPDELAPDVLSFFDSIRAEAAVYKNSKSLAQTANSEQLSKIEAPDRQTVNESSLPKEAVDNSNEIQSESVRHFFSMFANSQAKLPSLPQASTVKPNSVHVVGDQLSYVKKPLNSLSEAERVLLPSESTDGPVRSIQPRLESNPSHSNASQADAGDLHRWFAALSTGKHTH